MKNTLTAGDYPEFQKKYIDCVAGDVKEVLTKQKDSFCEFLDSLSNENLNFSYAEGKWTLKELIIHIIDTEAIFNTRALCVARGEKQALTGFDQDEYISNSNFDHLNKEYLINYFTIIRYNTLVLFKGIADEQWDLKGKISDYTMSLRAFPFMIAGHLQYHMNIIQERYILNDK